MRLSIRRLRLRQRGTHVLELLLSLRRCSATFERFELLSRLLELQGVLRHRHLRLDQRIGDTIELEYAASELRRDATMRSALLLAMTATCHRL